MKAREAQSIVVGLFCLSGILLLVGCSTPVKTDYKTGTDFSRYKTFALMPLPQQASTDDPGLVLRLAQPARDAVVSQLTAKGMTEAPTNQADLSVNLRGRSLPRIEVRDYGYTYPAMTRYGTYPVVVNPYTTISTTQERTLIIEMLDNHTKELVWVGWTKKESSKQVTAEALQKAIQEILAEFPPPPPASPKPN
jgi:S-methylmethionine-dependent homocysteine/selenocysteine methylase